MLTYSENSAGALVRPISTQAPEVVEAAFKDVLAEQSNMLHDLQLKEHVPSIRIF